MEDIEGVDKLKSVFKAQTEAYLEFNTALITLLSNQKEILSKVESLKIFSEDEFRNLSKEYHALEKLFVNFQNQQQSRDSELEGSVDDFKATITNFHENIDTLTNEVIKVKKLQYDAKNFWTRIAWSLGGIILFLTLFQLFTGKGILDFIKHQG